MWNSVRRGLLAVFQRLSYLGFVDGVLISSLAGPEEKAKLVVERGLTAIFRYPLSLLGFQKADLFLGYLIKVLYIIGQRIATASLYALCSDFVNLPSNATHYELNSRHISKISSFLSAAVERAAECQ